MVQAVTADGVVHNFPDGTPDSVIDTAIMNYVGGNSAPAPQMTGGWRLPALIGSNLAKGAIGGVSGLADLAVMGAGQAADAEMNGGANKQDFTSPGLNQAALGAAKDAGIVDRPDLVPGGAFERYTAAASRGAGAALPFAAMGGAPGLAMGALTGATGGATGEFARGQFPSSPDLAEAVGNLAGGLGAFGLTRGASRLASPLTEGISRRIVPGATDNQAANRIVSAIQKDASAGGANPSDMAAELSTTNKPMIAPDVGGENLKALMGQVARAPGEGRQVVKNFLNARDAGSGDRLLNDVGDMISNGKTAFQTTQDLTAARSQAAAPLYDKAFQAGPVDTPEINGLIKNSAAVRGAINSAKANYPQFAGLPDNDIRLLDQAYKAIGGKAQAARQSGDGALAFNLDSLRDQFKTAITKSVPSYGEALDAFSGPSDSMRAVELGQKIFRQSPEQTAADIAKLSAGDKDFYLTGAADAIRNRILSTSSGGDEAKKIVGNMMLQRQLRPLFSSDAEHSAFIKAATQESQMFQTRFDALGGSQTAGRLAQDKAGGHEGGMLLPLATSVIEHNPMGVALFGSRLLQDVLSRSNASVSPQVNAAIARALTTTGPGASRYLDMALQKPGLLGSGATVPLGLLSGAASRQ